ncbi:MAG: UdgX family uracil-DNA binding protein [Streptosporangiales bacterium]
MADPRPAGAEQYLPERRNLTALRKTVDCCRGCGLYENATQAVLGAGPAQARLLLVGEQPGDQEDRQGAPFVGPAGRMLDRALGDVGTDRRAVYLTNVVKHFKFERAGRGKRRLHKKPRQGEVTACRPWFDAELDAVRPRVVVCLGATAAKALLGSSFRLTQHRGELIDFSSGGRTARQALATIHPSAVLRAQDDREEVYEGFRADLAIAVEAAG